MTSAGSYRVSAEAADTYARDGAVLLDQPFARSWIDGLVAAFEEIEREHAAGRFLGDIFRQDGRLEIAGAIGAHPFVRRWALESQAAEIAARVIGSSAIRLYTDHDIAFGKRGDARSARIGATSFHIDASAWGFTGAMIPSFWLALTDVGEDFGPLVIAAGSHRRMERLILPSPIDPSEPVPEGYAPYSAMQAFLDEHRFEMKVLPAKRGDVVVLHPYVAHGSLPMNRAGSRLAFSTRWLGDDARWHVHAHTGREVSEAGAAEGAPPDEAKYPLVWEARRGLLGGAPEVARIHAYAAARAKFHVVHLYTGRDGRTRLEALDPTQASEHLPYLYKEKATSVAVLRYPAGQRFDWHVTPGTRRLMVQLRGLSVVIVDEGHEPGVSYHPLQPGSVILAEDLSGRGHRGRVFEDEDVFVMQVDLAATSGAAS